MTNSHISATAIITTDDSGGSLPAAITVAKYLPNTREMMANAAGLRINTDVHMNKNAIAGPRTDKNG